MPLLLQKNLSDIGRMAVWHITETVADLRSRLQLNEEEQAYLSTIAHPERLRSWLGSRVLLRHLLNTEAFIEVKTTDQGKPYLSNFPQHISISHSGDYAAVIISGDKQVGIDLERVRDKVRLIARKFLSESELTFISKEQEVEHLTQCWSAKEAIFKWYGKGNLPFKEGIVLHPFDAMDSVIHADLFVAGKRQPLMLASHFIDGYVLAWLTAPLLL